MLEMWCELFVRVFGFRIEVRLGSGHSRNKLQKLKPVYFMVIVNWAGA